MCWRTINISKPTHSMLWWSVAWNLFLLPAAVNRIPEQGSRGRCCAQYDYEATEPNQISFRVGDIIDIINKTGESSGWWKGSNGGQVCIVSVWWKGSKGGQVCIVSGWWKGSKGDQVCTVLCVRFVLVQLSALFLYSIQPHSYECIWWWYFRWHPLPQLKQWFTLLTSYFNLLHNVLPLSMFYLLFLVHIVFWTCKRSYVFICLQVGFFPYSYVAEIDWRRIKLQFSYDFTNLHLFYADSFLVLCNAKGDRRLTFKIRCL